MFNFQTNGIFGFQRQRPPLHGGPGIDPNVHAQNYANEKGISLEEAKTELRAMYGDPRPPQQTSSIFSGGPQQPGDYDPIGQRSKPDGSPNTTQGNGQFLNLIQTLISLILGNGPQKPGDYDPIGQRSKPDGSPNF